MYSVWWGIQFSRQKWSNPASRGQQIRKNYLRQLIFYYIYIYMHIGFYFLVFSHRFIVFFCCVCASSFSAWTVTGKLPWGIVFNLHTHAHSYIYIYIYIHIYIYILARTGRYTATGLHTCVYMYIYIYIYICIYTYTYIHTYTPNSLKAMLKRLWICYVSTARVRSQGGRVMEVRNS